MKKVISLTLLVFVLAGVISAQENKYVAGGKARTMALGGSPTSAFIMDYTDIYTNPAWASKYSDLVYSELGWGFAGYNANQQSIGLTYALNSNIAIGLSVGNQEGYIFAANSYGSQFGSTVTNADNMIGGISGAFTAVDETIPATGVWRPLQLYTAFKLGGMTLGAAIYRTSWSAKEDYLDTGDTINTKGEASINQTGFKVGLLMDMNTILLDASALIRINSASGKLTPQPLPAGNPSNVLEAEASGTEIALNARLFMKMSEKFTLVPMVRFATFSYEPELKRAAPSGSKYNTKPNKYSRSEFEVGVGTNINVKSGKVFAGLTLESISLKNEVTSFVGGGTPPVAINTPTATTKYKESILSLPKLSIAAEFDVASWLTGRIGYFKAFASRTSTYEPPYPAPKEEYEWTENNFAFCPSCSLATADQLLSVGLGFHFDRVSIDGYLCEEWLADGPYILSGSVNKMFGVLSVSYSFL